MNLGTFLLLLTLWHTSRMDLLKGMEDNTLPMEIKRISEAIEKEAEIEAGVPQSNPSQENSRQKRSTDNPERQPPKSIVRNSSLEGLYPPKKGIGGRERRGRAHRRRPRNDIFLWIDEDQVKMFSGYNMEIYAILNGRVMPYILDPEFEEQLPVIPSEVNHVNFTWRSARKRYFYHFDWLVSFDKMILKAPFVSIKKKGRVPRRPKVFSVRIPCVGNSSGVATFGIGLRIQTKKGTPLPGTPLRLRLRKSCELTGGPDPACDEKCANGGVCDEDRRCRCALGYMGQFCNVALCYPQCRNGGTCSSPGRCTCPPGYHGRICEGGICHNKCLNGGKCIQKDTCACKKGYYGNRCEFST